jgi:hypothetical protein
VRGLRNQSREVRIVSLAIQDCPAQQDTESLSSERGAWIGGHGTEPYEQNTQQSSGLGRRLMLQPVHV